MTTAATRLREAIITRLAELPGYNDEIRRTPNPQLQPDKLPSLSVYITGERLTPDGDDNAGPPAFESEITIAISDVRGFEHPTVLDGSVDAAVDLIEATLLTDMSFVGFGENAFFEAVTGITRRRMFPQNGETYFAELRLEMTFMLRVGFDPVITDDLEQVEITSTYSEVAPGQHPRARVILPTS